MSKQLNTLKKRVQERMQSNKKEADIAKEANFRSTQNYYENLILEDTIMLHFIEEIEDNG